MPFNSDSQPKPTNRKPRGRGKKTSMLEALRLEIEGGETEFLQKVTRYAFGDGEKIKPNLQLMLAVLQRLEPPIKSTMPLVKFTFNTTLNPFQQAAQVTKAASEGKIPSDVAVNFMSLIQAMMKIKDITEIEERLLAVEKRISEQA